MKTLPLILVAALACAGIVGCQTATATKLGKDGTQDTIAVKSFLSTISNGAYSNGTGMTLSVSLATPDQQTISILAGSVVDLAKALAKPPTNAPPVTTNTVTDPNPK